MRSSALARGALVLSTALLASSCDWSGVSGAGGHGNVGIVIPRIASATGLAAQTLPTAELEFTFRVQVHVVRTGEQLLDGRYTQRDVQLNVDPNSNNVGTLPVRFRLPSDPESESYTIKVEVFDLLGNHLFDVGPITFTLGPDGRTATVTGDLTYVGPGSNVVRVEIQPRTLSLAVGATGQVTCNGFAANSTTPISGTFLHSLRSETPSVATVTQAGVVTGVAPGTSRISCQLEFGSRATDFITVTVTGGTLTPANITLVSGGNQTGPAGSALPVPIRVRVTSSSQQNVPGVLVRFTVSAGAGSLNANDVTTAADGTAEVIWTLGTPTGLQALAIVVVGQSGLNLLVNATATAPTTATILATVRNAADGSAVAGASVQLRSGTVQTGTPLATGTSNAQGVATFSNLSPGLYNLTAIASGFANATGQVTVASGQVQSTALAVSPVLSAGQVRIVLSWGPSPPDLDAHLRLPDGTFVFWQNPGSCPSGLPTPCLQNDETNGFGPETMIIGQVQTGTYTFFVHNYTADFNNLPAGDNSLALSGATVSIYVGAVTSPTQTVTVPNLAGKLWTVVNLVVAANGTVTIQLVNTMADSNMADTPPSAGARAGAVAGKIRKGGDD